MDHQAIILAGDVVLGLVWVVVYAVTMKRWTPERGRVEAVKWADRREVTCDERWLDPIQRQLRTNLQADLIGMFFLFSVLVQVPAPVKPYAACLVGLPAVAVVARGLTFSRMILPPGTRVARARELGLSDYLPTRSRLLAWFAAAGGMTACVVMAATGDQWLVAASGLLVVAPPLALEWAGRRLVRMPEPADSAAHLLLQDQFRSSLLRLAALRSAMAATMLTGYLGLYLLDGAEAAGAVLTVVGIGLLVALLIDGASYGDDRGGYVRERLWPIPPRGPMFRAPHDRNPNPGVA